MDSVCKHAFVYMHKFCANAKARGWRLVSFSVSFHLNFWEISPRTWELTNLARLVVKRGRLSPAPGFASCPAFLCQVYGLRASSCLPSRHFSDWATSPAQNENAERSPIHTAWVFKESSCFCPCLPTLPVTEFYFYPDMSIEALCDSEEVNFLALIK